MPRRSIDRRSLTAPGGFTLIEMLIVITIISILAAMAITSISNSAKDTRTIIAQQQLAVLEWLRVLLLSGCIVDLAR